MSISNERFAAEGLHLTYDPYEPTERRIAVFQMQCRSCGYEPEDAVTPPKTCPKCRSTSWERFALPGSILANSERY
jgi:predicted Zn-ribbon and HTH transcriptional regulator